MPKGPVTPLGASLAICQAPDLHGRATCRCSRQEIASLIVGFRKWSNTLTISDSRSIVGAFGK